VSLDWKWLFIYPDAEGRERQPAGRARGHAGALPHDLAGVMNSFFVPQLGSQIYTMAGMTTRLNLLADEPGTYRGLSAQFSGDGFSDMRFDVVALPRQDFEQWVDATRAGGGTLDAAATSLAQAERVDPQRTFGTVAASSMPSSPIPAPHPPLRRSNTPNPLLTLKCWAS
jgi:cytochrome o ubiquinol oxidase subunit 2